MKHSGYCGKVKEISVTFNSMSLIFFYYNEHEPIHVHAKYGEFESKAEFIIEDVR